MSDLISRQAAIDALGERPMVWVGSDYELGARNQYDADVLALETVPSAQPTAEPDRHGKWIKADSQQYFRKHYPCFTCSECGYRKDSQKTWNYCPNCGADMREVTE